MKNHLLIAAAILIGSVYAVAEVIDLAGKWSICHHAADSATAKEITLPGSMLTNNIGNPVTVDTKWTGSLFDLSYYHSPIYEKYRQPGNIKFPFFLTPEKEYVGKAVYTKTVYVPENWKGKCITLFLERPHIETRVCVNSRYVGTDSTLSVPHEFDVTDFIVPGRDNLITINVYNGIENVCVGQDSHSVTDQTQGNWNGIAGRIELQARPKTHIKKLDIYPCMADKSVNVKLKLANASKKIDVTLIANNKKKTYPVKTAADGTVTLNFPMGNFKPWDEFTPNLYTMTAIVGNDTVNHQFGMRKIEIRDRQFYINDRPTFMRGTVENCNFPLTGFPPTDVESWIKVFDKCKEYGLNHMRFHSYCPPEAAFVAADRVGFYLQPEGPSWPNHGVKLGVGMSIDRFLMQETQRMVEAYGNHPSFTMLAAGNEPAGNWVEWVGDFVDTWRASGDNRRVYCGASVGGGWAWDPKSEYHVKGGARGLTWDKKRPGSADDFANDMETVVQKGRTQTLTFPVKEPRLGHETGQWCAYPDFNEISQYTGVYKAKNFEIFRETLADNGMASQFAKFLNASGKLQQLAYKYDIEKNLRTPNYAGFQMLGLNDYSGQGTALVGVLNVMWREKGYTDKKKWQGFCAPIVPLARFAKFVYETGEQLTVPIELYNSSASTLDNVPVKIIIIDPAGRMILNTQLTKSFVVGKNQPVDTVNLPLVENLTTGKYNLCVSVGSNAENNWDLWVYPNSVEMPEVENLYITSLFDKKAEQVLRNGGNVLLTAAGMIKYGNDIKQHYLPVFWNTSWFKMRPPHTTGATIDTTHPVFDEFPTDDWTNINWWELVNKAQVMNLSRFPAGYQSPMQPIDTWHLNRKLGMIVEAKVLNGKLFMTTFDIDHDLDKRPVARQMRKSILSYLGSDKFNPRLTIDPMLIHNLYDNEAEPIKMYSNDDPDELKPVLK
ncbi:MAG: beta-glucuronidase [Muribaculum sp.]|nr:beta-glucuronidase [Muribaculaceae bacterium]MCM1080571.1 beta-glucuronidase [Muribaculum sp.]